MQPQLAETDKRSRIVLPGHAEERFIVQDNGDGSILLLPARVMSNMQYAYDTDPEFRAMLDEAMASPRVYLPRRKRRTS